MNGFIDTVGAWAINHETLRHLFVAVAIIIQGELGTFVSVTLVLEKYLTWTGFFLSALGGILLYDSFLFSIGKALKNKPLGKRWENKIRHNTKINRYLKNNLSYLLIVARFLMYINIGAMVLAGLMDMKTKEFFKNRFLADILWISVLATGSYLIISGLTLLKLRHFEIAIGLFLVAALAGHTLLRKFLAKEVR